MVTNKNISLLFFILLSAFYSCKEKPDAAKSAKYADSVRSCMQVPSRFSNMDSSASIIAQSGDTSNAGMAYIKAGSFSMGADNEQADKDEYPKHAIKLSASG